MTNKRKLRNRTKAAEFLGLDPSTLWRMEQRGEGPAFYRISRKTIVYDEDDLLDWVEKQRVEFPSDPNNKLTPGAQQ